MWLYVSKQNNSFVIADSDFKQQRLPTWEPTASPLYVIAMLFLIGIAFIPAGIDLKAQSDGVHNEYCFM